MKKVFISQPMNGISNEKIRKDREKIIKILEGKGYEIIDSIIAENAPENTKEAVYYLGKSIELLSTADYICMMLGWQYARGCSIEWSVATDYGIERLYEEDLKE
jgi:hypothetical protein